MTESPEFANDSDATPEPEVGGEGWSGADIEEAYLKALQAMEDVAREEGLKAETAEETPAVGALSSVIPEAADDSAATGATIPAAPAGTPTGNADSLAPTSESPVASPAPADSPGAAPASGLRLAAGTARPRQDSPEEQLNVSPAQVIEAALFVGGGPLTARKIVGLLRGSYEVKAVEQTVDNFNDAYLAQARPYEIRLGEGGYRLELRPEYDRLRHRVYGSGPREVRLSQDVLEVLALVAYRQPISEKEIEDLGKQNAGNLLRQLLRRDLVAFERGPGGRKDVRYHTTPRFLSVFGLASLNELPQADDLAKK